MRDGIMISVNDLVADGDWKLVQISDDISISVADFVAV
jgi:hypothetical protein